MVASDMDLLFVTVNLIIILGATGISLSALLLFVGDRRSGLQDLIMA